MSRTGIANYVTYIGQGGPRFYYNVVPETLLIQLCAGGRQYRQLAAATSQLVKELSSVINSKVPGARIEIKFLEQGPPVGAPLQIVVRGPELTELKRLSAEIQSRLNSVDGVIHARDNFGKDSYLLKLVCDDSQLRAAGLTPAQVKLATAFAMSGMPITSFRAPDRQIPVIARVMPELRQNSEDLNRLYLTNPLTGAASGPGQRGTDRDTAHDEPDRAPEWRTAAHRQCVCPEGLLPSEVLKLAKPLVDAHHCRRATSCATAAKPRKAPRRSAGWAARRWWPCC